jgi:ubiquinone/menaquinone biosynthesis C-methylase UbiE
MSQYYLFKESFKGVSLEVEDLYLLESFQIGYFPGWVPEPELAAVLHANPPIKRFLIKKCAAITDYIKKVMTQNAPAADGQELDKDCDKLLWTIADILIYNKCPETYDNLEFHNWDFREITVITPLDGKTVIDGGAGTGRVTLEAARTARQVYAVEPVCRLRQFIREKALNAYRNNIHVVDGFLHSIPLPDNFADVLITSHALGWQLENELWEFERVVKRGGYIIHCPGTAEVPEEEAQHYRLTSPDWRYEFSRYRESDGWKRKYWKQV